MRFRQAVAAIWLAAACLLLSACSSVDRQQAAVCVAVATAIAPQGQPIAIRSVAPLSGIDNAVRVIFLPDKDVYPLFADCVFGGGPLESGRAEVVGVRGRDGVLTEREILDLHRWFLDQPGAIAAAIAETDWQAPSFAVLDIAPPKAVGFALQQATNTLNVAAFYVPLALAYALIYGLIGRINMAFGEIAMIGAFGAVFGIETAILARLPGIGIAILLAFAAAISLAALCGWLVGRLVVTPLADAPPRPFIVATVGLALVLSEGVRIAQGAREIWLQPMMETPIVLTGGDFPVVVTQMRLTIVAATLIILPLILWFMRRSSFGKAWRAVADDRLMARLSGIDPLAVTAATFVLASALAAGGGTVIALSYGGTSYSIGFLIGLKALFASLIGGAGSLMGAVLGGFLIALLETGWSAYFGSSDRDIVVLVVITLLFVLRPNGLLGRGHALEEGRIPRLS
ncbi:hypothetical protein C3941_11595 [Kaistia algarum]|uniref:branched-chain amino acid ABC transporter permease n=1 Tax=Kaistia algarum TaxID=2083279 RepID=UPI000CE7AC39|nr:branched-chain amino acid ABC transporter permease [Kaistia algarum]MCX5514990.1 branched-chain amino acid ABC transporter permease [Kaistia algarum]PPE79731.1 hypothetical protein C3941_11595 [Kaistia algarum]